MAEPTFYRPLEASKTPLLEISSAVLEAFPGCKRVALIKSFIQVVSVETKGQLSPPLPQQHTLNAPWPLTSAGRKLPSVRSRGGVVLMLCRTYMSMYVSRGGSEDESTPRFPTSVSFEAAAACPSFDRRVRTRTWSSDFLKCWTGHSGSVVGGGTPALLPCIPLPAATQTNC